MPKRTLSTLHSSTKLKQASLLVWQAGELQHIQLDSPAWFDWLAQEYSFRLVYRADLGQEVSLTIRPEKRGQRTYWQAWKTSKGRTHKKYLAPTAKLTKAKLDSVGHWFFELIEARQNQDDSLILYAAVTDLVWLVERFLESHPDSPVADRAEAELKRIRLLVGN